MKNAESSTTIEEHSFSSLPLREELISNISSLGYHKMTPVQAQSLPIMLKKHDAVVQAETGSGKTAAFGLTLLNVLQVENYVVQALILCPTRELSEQVAIVLRQLARKIPNVKILNLSGGMPTGPQTDSLRHGAHIIVGTPGRIKKHLDSGSLLLNKLQILVLDEADRMLDMGFFDVINEIITLCPRTKQTILFSATYPEEIHKIANKFMRAPKKIIVKENETAFDIQQYFYEVDSYPKKFPLLKSLLLHYQPLSTLIFCNTKDQTLELTAMLLKQGFSAIALNGDMEQIERDLAVIRFKNNSCSIMVATDVAARGLDIKELPAVINFDLAFEHDVHIHRIGRTGRAGHKGLALSITTPADGERLCIIEKKLNGSIPWGKVEDLKVNNTAIFSPVMVTLSLKGGRKDKIRPGDILGALTKDAGIAADMIGKINVGTLFSYVAIHRSKVDIALQYFKNGNLKGRKANVKKLR
ncbi:MAG TPA: ATP-dependent RNA helicase DbpA [Gammaproteobacteria bacterium]|jgi:ATP-independent RNA helicase DbpA|nr:ATP-dependent RNA helicase DbpA [Gammaproteobacteria bacterium]